MRTDIGPSLFSPTWNHSGFFQFKPRSQQTKFSKQKFQAFCFQWYEFITKTEFFSSFPTEAFGPSKHKRGRPSALQATCVGDLFVSNGIRSLWLGLAADQTWLFFLFCPKKLYTNEGFSNHWIIRTFVQSRGLLCNNWLIHHGARINWQNQSFVTQ